MRYPFYTRDVFTEPRFGGNQLAVLPRAEGFSPRLARCRSPDIRTSGPRPCWRPTATWASSERPSRSPSRRRPGWSRSPSSVVRPAGVAPFATFDRIAAPFREVALLDAWGTSDDVTNTMLYPAQRKKAASLGANAVIVGTLREPTTLGNLLETSSDQRRSAATAIYIPADTHRVRVACAARK